VPRSMAPLYCVMAGETGQRQVVKQLESAGLQRVQGAAVAGLRCRTVQHMRTSNVTGSENEGKSETHQQANSDEVPHSLGVGRWEAVRVAGLQMRARLGSRDLEMVLQDVVHDLVGAKAGENQQVAQPPARTPRCGPDGAGLALLCPARLSRSFNRCATQMLTAS
jgi:hypothetical protein